MRSLIVTLLVLPIFFPSDCQVRRENVALYKDCNIESSWLEKYPPELAVNINTGGMYERNPPNCIHTGLNHTNTWWEVDLGRSYPVYSITVWGRVGYLYRMNGCIITVDGQHCYTSVDDTSSNEININCTGGVQTGRVVRVSKSGRFNVGSDYTINICEFQVWTCVSGTYGRACGETCSKCANNETCNRETGHCPACPPGLMPPMCKQECDIGKYGQNCRARCDHGCSGSACSADSGACDCVAGWLPPLCQEQIKQSDNTSIVGVIVGVVVSVGAVIAAIIIVGLLLLRRSQTKLQARMGMHSLVKTGHKRQVESSAGETAYEGLKYPENTYETLQPLEL